MDPLIHSIHNVHLIESTIDEEDSFILLKELSSYPLYSEKYFSPPLPQQDTFTLVSNFSFFCGKVKDSQTNKYFSSNIPIVIFRYLMTSDNSWSYYYTPKKQKGYVVEGMQWSNGYFYQVRQDVVEDFDIYQVVLCIDSFTKRMYNFPEVYNVD